MQILRPLFSRVRHYFVIWAESSEKFSPLFRCFGLRKPGNSAAAPGLLAVFRCK
jgi:hypothetical protein